MPATVLITLGRLPKGLELARAFARNGYRVVIAEPFPVHLARVSNAVAKHVTVTAPARSPSRYIEDLLAVVDAEGVELVLPVSEEISHAAALADRLPQGVRFFGPGQATVLALHDKLAFARRVAELGLGVPETFGIGELGGSELAAEQDVVSKPRFSCAGRGVRHWPAGSDLAAVPSDHLVQRRIEGRHVSSFSIAHGGQVLLTVLYEGRVFSGTAAVCFARLSGHEGAERWIEAFAAAEHYSGFISFDFIVDAADRVFAIECNPRTTSGIHFVQPEALVQAIVDPANAVPAFKPEPVLQEFYSTLTAAYGQFFRPRRFVAMLRELKGARDVTWDRRDPWVFPLMTFTTWRVIWGSIRTGEPFGVVATRDIEWQPSSRLEPLTPQPAGAAPGT